MDYINRPNVYITAKDDPTKNPDWLLSNYGIPDNNGRSEGAVIIIHVDKSDIVGPGVSDVFYFFFYSFNLGNKVFFRRYGNHVGDWEHTMIRFKDGKPEYVYVSQHAFGSAYNYSCLEMIGQRPVVFSAIGTHGMYVTEGAHHYTRLGPLLGDHTGRGPLWDPTLNYLSFDFSKNEGFTQYENNSAPTSFLRFAGRWGDKKYPDSDPRQYHFLTEYAWSSGPTGPIAKNLLRLEVCQTLRGDDCIILNDRDKIYIEEAEEDILDQNV